MQNGGADRLAGVDLLYLSGISLAILPDEARTEAIDLLASLKDRLGRIAFDANVRPALWRDLDAARAGITPMIRIADILRASREDAALLYGTNEPQAQIEAFRVAGACEIALTLGGQGCVVATEDGEGAVPAPRRSSISTTPPAPVTPLPAPISLRGWPAPRWWTRPMRRSKSPLASSPIPAPSCQPKSRTPRTHDAEDHRRPRHHHLSRTQLRHPKNRDARRSPRPW